MIFELPKLNDTPGIQISSRLSSCNIRRLVDVGWTGRSIKMEPRVRSVESQLYAG